MKKGILGGTFNPIHYAHIALAKAAKEQFGLDELIFMPSKKPAYKDTEAIESEENRLNMVKLAVKTLGGEAAGYIASDFEYKREGNTYTYETLTLLHEAEPDTEFFFIIGADSLMKFDTWVKPEVISNLCTLLVAGRNGISKKKLTSLAKKTAKKYDADIRIIDFQQIDISSTEIRENLSENNECEYIPEMILDYIRTKGLYNVKA